MSKCLAVTGFVLALFVSPVVASPSAVIQLSGCCWEDGGLQTSVFGEQFTAVGLITNIKRPLFWSPTRYSYTFAVSNLMSLGEVRYGDVQVIEYAGGTLRIMVDALPSNADFGTFPPNATSPATFADGTGVYLEGFFTEFMTTMNTVTHAGSVSGSLTFTDGNAFPQLTSPDGWTVGAVLGTTAPPGYDASWNGSLYVAGPLFTESVSWADLKALYR